MKPAAYHHTLFADEPVSTPDGEGGQDVVWHQRFAFRAALVPLSARELMRGEQMLAELDTRVLARATSLTRQIDARWRLRLRDNQTYDIIRPPINRSMGNVELEFLVRTGARVFPPIVPAEPGNTVEGSIFLNGGQILLNGGAIILTAPGP